MEFWELTPFEFNCIVKSFVKTQKSERQERISIAYAQAQWTAQWATGKTKPRPLKKILDSMDKPQRPMTDNEMLEKVKQLNEIFGGERKNGE